jgi:predicted amino acid-binding ACT domain protein
MHPIGSRALSWTQRLALSTLCSLLLLTSASAAPSRSDALGTVLQVPLMSLGPFMAQNIAHQNNISLLHVSQTAIGDFNSQVATVSVRQYNKNGKKLEPARKIWLPNSDLGWIKQTNRDTVFITQDVYGSGNMQVAEVQVQQANASTSKPVTPGTRFLLTPLSGLGQMLALNQRNVNLVRINQLAVGDANSQVALLSVDQQNANKVKVPKTLVSPLVQLNLNLTVINQTAIGNGNSQVAVVDVGQDNNLSSPAS